MLNADQRPAIVTVRVPGTEAMKAQVVVNCGLSCENCAAQNKLSDRRGDTGDPDYILCANTDLLEPVGSQIQRMKRDTMWGLKAFCGDAVPQLSNAKRIG